MESGIILDVPRRITPIVDVRDHALAECPSPPFFGYAPAETPVRIVHCPECHCPVSAAHLHLHRASHETRKRETTLQKDHFPLYADSKLAPLTPCAFAERHNYTLKTMFERDAK
jgi:hypothetical protein